MKRSAQILFFTVLLITTAKAQVFNHNRGVFDKSNKKMIQQLFDKTTTVFTKGGGAYNDRLKESFNTYWKVNPIQFSEKGSETKVEPNSGIFQTVIVSTLTGQGNATSQNYPFYVYGQAESTGLMTMSSMIAAFPISFYYEFDVLSDSNLYHRSILRLPYMVKALNDMLMYVKVNGDNKGYSDSIEAKSGRIASKTLIIPADLIKEFDVNPNITALMKNDLSKGRKPMKQIMYNSLEESAISDYAGNYKIMSNEEIMKLEKSADADKYTIFLPAISDRKYLEVYDLKTKELLFFDEITMSVKIKGKDFEKINKAAGLKK